MTYEGPGLSEEDASKIGYKSVIGINGIRAYFKDITYTNEGSTPLAPFTLDAETLGPALFAYHTDPEEMIKITAVCLYNDNKRINVHENDKTLDILNLKLTAEKNRWDNFEFKCGMDPQYK